jgi:1-phosphofructokinase family hexose kinase
MIVCVNANAAIDRVMFIDRFLPGQTMRPEIVLDCVGGKGADSALVLSVLGAPHRLITFGAGESGLALESLYRKFGIRYDLVWVEGETRTAHVIVETDLNRHSHITTRGYQVTSQDCCRFSDRLSDQVSAGDWVIIAGSLPEGAPESFYHEITSIVHARGGKVLIDCTGKPLEQALLSGPDVVKLNQLEFHETFGTSSTNLIDLEKNTRQALHAHNLNSIVITLGDEGILAVTQAESYFAYAPKVTEVNAAGAGDAASAAIAFRLAQGDDWTSALQWACACGAAVVLTQGTAECSLENIVGFLAQVSIKHLRQCGSENYPVLGVSNVADDHH